MHGGAGNLGSANQPRSSVSLYNVPGHWTSCMFGHELMAGDEMSRRCNKKSTMGFYFHEFRLALCDDHALTLSEGMKGIEQAVQAARKGDTLR